jgi:pimeloyl-ACP methyl ester carboxylesterase
MMPVLNALQAEVLKLKRTMALRLVVLASTVVVLLAFFIQSVAITRGIGDFAAALWDSYPRNALTLWAVFLMPLLITVEAALVGAVEHGKQQWKHLFALPVPRHAIYVAKFLVLQALIALGTVLVGLFVIASGWMLIQWHPVLAASGPAPIASILSQVVQCWLASGLILSVSLWVALRWPSFTAPLGVGIAGTFFALFAQSAIAAKYYPWLLPLDTLSGTDRTAALAIGIGGGILIATIGCIDFVRREESAPPQLAASGMAALAAVLLGFVGVGLYLDRETLWAPRASYATRFVTVDKDVKLEVLDWGGTGRPIILLSGLGDTAHVFDKFAAQLTDRYHVYGITRRGFGASSSPPSGYSADRLGDDVLAVMEVLKLHKPILAGHSIGGEELSSIGSRYPDKIAGLVYLDAAYPYAYYDPRLGDFNIDLFQLDDKIERLKPGSGLRDKRPLMEQLLVSLGGFEKVLKEHLVQLDAISSEGDVATPSLARMTERQKRGLAAAQAIVEGEEKYAQIPAPMLAIYALPHDFGNSAMSASAAEAKDISDITGPQAKAFEAAFPSARVVRLPHASHYVFQSNQADVLRDMDAFITSLPQD